MMTLARHTPGTHFIGLEWKMVTPSVLEFTKIKPLFYQHEGTKINDALFFLGDKVVITGTEVDVNDVYSFLKYYLIEGSEENNKKASELCAIFNRYGIAVNLDALIPKKADGSVAGIPLKKTLRKTFKCPKKEDTGFHIDVELWDKLIRNVSKKKNTLLVGPTGTGKTEILRHLALAMGQELSIQDMGGVQDVQSSLLGVHRLAGDKSVFEYAPFVGYIQKPGLILLDEVNRGGVDARNLLFPVLDDRKYLPVDMASEESLRKIKVHEDIAFFGTANLGSDYSDTAAIDRALKSRFHMLLEFTYPSPKDEISVLMIKKGVNSKSAEAIVTVANEIRKQFASQDLSSSVSLRETLEMAEMVVDGWSILSAMETIIMPLFEADDTVNERTKIKSIIASR
jgi:energy-coupling factor transporter ATP-binding protein EcfA2